MVVVMMTMITMLMTTTMITMMMTTTMVMINLSKNNKHTYYMYIFQ